MHRLWNLLPGKLQWYAIYFFSPKFQVGITGVFFNKNNEVLLLKHVFRRNIVWELPGGILERGETIEHGAEREIFEETGFKAEVVGTLKINSGFKRRLGVVVYGRVDTNKEAILSSEIHECGLFQMNKLPSEIKDEHRGFIEKAATLLTV